MTVPAASLTRYGFPEYCNISTPPKTYLQQSGNYNQTYSDGWDWTATDYYGNTCEDTGHNFNNVSINYQISISALNGSQIINSNGFAINDYYENQIWFPFDDSGATWPQSGYTNIALANNEWTDGGSLYYAEEYGWLSGYGGGGSQKCGGGFYPPIGNNPGDVNVITNFASTAMSGSWTTTDPTNILPFGMQGWINYRGASTTLTLSVENDDVKLCGNIQGLLAASPSESIETNWTGSGGAYMSFGDTNCLYATADKIKYRFEINNWLPHHSYMFSYNLIKTVTFINSSNITVTNAVVPVEVSPAGDPSIPYDMQSVEIDVPSISPPMMAINITPNIVKPLVDITPSTPGD